jgi:ferritin
MEGREIKMISKKMQDAVNDQINAELYSSYLYLSMAAYFEEKNLRGMATWMTIQALEEKGHAMKFYNYIVERGGRVKLQAIAEPPFEWNSCLDVFKAALDHERYVTRRINDLTELAMEEKDHASQIFLQWFVTEQVEEEANAEEIINKLEFLSESKHGVYMLDKELGARVYPAEEE